jgi:uncharacterized protein (DUF1800 family)
MSSLAGLTAAAAACGRMPRAEWLIGRTSPQEPRIGRAPTGQAELRAARALNRAAYGARPGDVERVASMGHSAFVEEQLSPASIGDLEAALLSRRIESTRLSAPDIFDLAEKTAVADLRRASILRAIYSERQLYERMVEFWSDHFNIFVGKSQCGWLKVIDDREVIRKHAFGNFRDLLSASATSPAMLVYLDGGANSAGKPNENYAREILELHTLGVDGGYTQTDVMELARALTGWQVRTFFDRGRTTFRSKIHDPFAKQVLGLRLEGDASTDLARVVDRLTAHPATARFLSMKLCRRFVADEPPEGLVTKVAAAFTKSGGEVRPTLSALLHSQELLEAPPKFLRPYSFVLSALRRTGAASDGGRGIQRELESMGQLPFAWPSPDGYPDTEEHWSGRMLPRWNFALALATNSIPGTRVLAPGSPDTLALEICRPELQYC